MTNLSKSASPSEPRQDNWIRTALELANEWTAKFPLKGDASQEDKDAAEDVYAATRVALENQTAEPRPAARDWRSMCIVEIAAENPSVAEYCKHWGERAEKAEALAADRPETPQSLASDWYEKRGKDIATPQTSPDAAEPRRDEREAFQEFADSRGLEVMRWKSGRYASNYTNMAWEAWQAARASAAPLSQTDKEKS